MHVLSPTSERRNSYRLPLEPGQARVKLAGGRTIDLVDLSASGGSLRVPHAIGAPRLPARTRLDIELGDETVHTSFDVVTIRATEPGVYQLGARWGELGADGVRKLSRFIAHEFQRRTSRPERLLDGDGLRVKSPLYIRNLLGSRGDEARPLMSLVEEGPAYALAGKLAGQLRVNGVTFEAGRRVIRARFVGDEPRDSLCANRPYNFVLGGSSAVTVFESHCLSQSGRDVTLTLPAEVRQTTSRRSRRIDLGGADSPTLEVSFSHPNLDEGPRVTGRVFDVTAGGISFRIPAREHGLFPDDRLTDLRIRLGARELRARGRVRSIADRKDGGCSCGVELSGFDRPEHDVLWRRFVFSASHPNLIDGNQHAAASWSVLEASKYVELWTPSESRAYVRNEYVRAWQAPAPEVGHSLLVERGGAPAGMVAASLAFPQTWVFHHLGRDAKHDDVQDASLPLRQVLELMSGILHRLEMETDFERFLIYIERDKRINERLYSDFARNYFDVSKNQISAMEVFRRASAEPLPANDESEDPRVSVVAPSPERLARLAERLASTTTPLERTALALTPDLLDLGEFTRFAAAHGHERGRRIFFACEDGEVSAALVAESGSEGVNIFGLLNTCRIIALGDQPPTAAVRRALLRQATQHYRAIGKRHFLFYGESGENGEGAADTLPIALGFQHVSGGLRWVAHKDVIPAWLAYLEGVLASTSGPAARPEAAPLAKVAHS